MSLDTIAIPQCFVDIYPPEGASPVSFEGGSIIRCVTSKNIKAPNGTFSIKLAPDTLDQNLSWGQILTPMSFVVIGMRRGSKSAIVMAGVLNQIKEDQSWSNSAGVVTRTINLIGSDLSYYFTMADYYSLWLLAARGSIGVADLAAGLLTGDPGDVANQWYNQIMVNGVFKNTFVPYQDSPVTFGNLFGATFDKMNVTVPFSDYFMGTNNSWMDKFNTIIPFPFYEFFVTMNANDAYPGAAAGKPLWVTGLGSGVTAGASVIGRLNPVPMLVTSSNNNTPSFDSMDTSKWDALPGFSLEGAGFIESSIWFDDSQVKNFYNINFPYMTGLNGGTNSNFTLPIFNYASTGDIASVNRYGYRPMPMNIPWFADVQGTQAKADNAQQNNLNAYATLIGQLAGYYEATPLMANAETRAWLRPDIQIGTKFTYNPYKFQQSWDFYVEGVSHEYNFGSECSTTLTLTRGLPSDVYQDSGTGGLLFDIYTGNAQRKGGEYISGLPNGAGTPLAGIPLDQFANWLLQINKMYVTPQATQPASGSP